MHQPPNPFSGDQWPPKPPRPLRAEVHITNTFNGHCASKDCWCEPSNIYILDLGGGLDVLVIEHEDHDIGSMTRKGQIYARDQVQDWVTRYLDEV